MIRNWKIKLDSHRPKTGLKSVNITVSSTYSIQLARGRIHPLKKCRRRTHLIRQMHGTTVDWFSKCIGRRFVWMATHSDGRNSNHRIDVLLMSSLIVVDLQFRLDTWLGHKFSLLKPVYFHQFRFLEPETNDDGWLSIARLRVRNRWKHSNYRPQPSTETLGSLTWVIPSSFPNSDLNFPWFPYLIICYDWLE
jgi:hypothetical protein